MTRALLVEHLEDEGSGTFATLLPQHGLDLDVHLVQRDGPPPRRLPEGYDALVVMGGAMAAWELSPEEVELVATCERPYLGVCLGGQLLAHARGGSVTRGRNGAELGVHEVRFHAAAQADPLLHGLPPVTPAVQWHVDEIAALPPGATLLASSAAYPHQAFRLGAWAWGLQFHPEATPGIVRRWAVKDGADPTRHGEDVENAAGPLGYLAVTLAQRFAGAVQDAARAASKSSPGSPQQVSPRARAGRAETPLPGSV